MRVHGTPDLPTLVYLPGLHGDWSLVGSFRNALAGRVRFAEVTYPHTLTWTLEDHAAAIETALAERGIKRAWLLGESFSSQIVWPLLARGRLVVQGVVLAGGFVRHPLLWAVRLAERCWGGVPLGLVTRILFGYARVSRWRFRRSPETMKGIQEFVAGMTEEGRQAAKHRLQLLSKSDLCGIAKSVKVPIYAITGVLDPVVPWIWVRHWLKRNCPALREYKVIWKADHNVLGTAPDISAQQVLKWMGAEPEGPATWLAPAAANA
jgi:pimeloyl-ACP methyl ester carboxylesterase